MKATEKKKIATKLKEQLKQALLLDKIEKDDVNSAIGEDNGTIFSEIIEKLYEAQAEVNLLLHADQFEDDIAEEDPAED